MKFSNKGKAKFLDNRYWFLEEFNQDDFEGAIILSIEEAKHLLSIVMDSSRDHCINQEEADVFNKFIKKIKQMEKGND